MSHKIVSSETVKQYEESVAYFEGLIAQVKSYSSDTKDSKNAAVEAIRELEFDASVQKDKALMSDDERGAARARRFLGLQQAYQNVITLFEKPEDLLIAYEAQRSEAKRRLDEFKRMDQRDFQPQ